MKGKTRLRTAMVLAIGVAVGTTMMATPATGHVGGTVHHLIGHLKAVFYTKSQSNARFLPGGNLPAGKTVRGTYWMGDTAAAGFDLATSEISFGWRFAAAPTPHFIQSGTTPPAACPGTATAPAARPGHLCVYESLATNEGLRNVNGPSGDGSTYRFGARLFIRSAAAGNYYSGGTWAATAAAPTARPVAVGTRKQAGE
jgi:hypothetical protein